MRVRIATKVPGLSRHMRHTKEPSKLKSIPDDLNSDQSVLSEARCLRMKAQGPAGGEVLEVESVPCGDDS